MWKAFQRRDVLVRILLGIVVSIIGIGMLLYLVPQGSSTGTSADTVAEVAGEPVTAAEVSQQVQRLERRGNLPRSLAAYYVPQVVDQLIYQRMLEIEAVRLGIRVTEEELADRVRQILPTAVAGDTFVGMERYAPEVQARFDMSVAEFEGLVRQGLLEEKIRRLVTDGVSVTPGEVQEEFRRRNEKIKIEYVLLKPEEMQSKVTVTDTDLAAYFEKNKARYLVPERRVVRYALLDLSLLRQRVSVTEEELHAYYNGHIDRYRIQNRAHVSHILFKTIGKTDAEVQETRRKAEDVLKKAKHGGKFEDLAKQFSEDTTKEKGGDLGWIVPGQTVPEFEQSAFSLAPGTISDLVKTQYGFHIIKVLERQTTRTQTFEEMKASILPIVSGDKAERAAGEQADKMATATRQTNRPSLDELGKQFSLTIGETRPLAANEPALELGNSPELREVTFRLRPGDLSSSIRTDRGFVVLSIKEIQPSHPGTLAEVREKATADYRQEKAVELVKSRAAEVAKRMQSGESMAGVAKGLGVEQKTSEPFSRVGSVPGVGSARQLSAGFALSAGQVGQPLQVGTAWLLYRVIEREDAKPEDFLKQRGDTEQQVLQAKRGLAYDAFRTALEDRFKQEGKLKMYPENLKRLSSPLS